MTWESHVIQADHHVFRRLGNLEWSAARPLSIDRLIRHLTYEFTDKKGFSRTNFEKAFFSKLYVSSFFKLGYGKQKINARGIEGMI